MNYKRLRIINNDDKKISLYFSFLLISIYITNVGDVVGEIIGGGLQQNNISFILKIFCALAFIYCVPLLIRHFTKKKLFLILISLTIVLINLLFFNIDQFYDTIFTYFSFCLTSALLIDCLDNYSILKSYLIYASRIIGFLSFIVLFLDNFGLITSLKDSGYRMGLGYACAPSIMFILYNVIKNKKFIDFLFLTILLFLLISYCSRGPLFCIGLFGIYFIMKYFHNNGHDLIVITVLIFFSIFVVYFKDFVNILDSLLTSLGISSRTLYLFINKNLGYDSGRDLIWNGLISEISKNPFRIRGINSEYLLYNTYAHNIIIELIYQHGIIIGGFFLLIIFHKMIKSLFSNINNDRTLVYLIFLFSSIPALMVSGSLWTNQYFWIWFSLL